jgi:hypothetical protein
VWQALLSSYFTWASARVKWSLSGGPKHSSYLATDSRRSALGSSGGIGHRRGKRRRRRPGASRARSADRALCG